MDIVEQSKIGVATSSLLVSRKFGMRHSKVMEVIKSMLVDYPDLNESDGLSKAARIAEKWLEVDRESRGKTYKVILMNREFFTLLAGRFKTKKAREWQRNFNNAFYAMEDRLLQMEHNKKSEEWLGLRSQGKLQHRDFTDAVQEFVNYATEQGSKNAKRYYGNIHRTTYKALGIMQQVKPSVRDSLDGVDLWQLIIAERAAKKAFRKYMDAGHHYKEIYLLVKADIEKLTEAMMIEKPKGIE